MGTCLLIRPERARRESDGGRMLYLSRLLRQPGIFLLAAMSDAPQTVMDAATLGRCVKRLAHEIVERNQGAANLALLGVVRRGASLAVRLRQLIHEITGTQVSVGTIDISLYRDDGKGDGGDPRLVGREIPFHLDGIRVVLVDDVLYTGRTVRAALDALADLGKPEAIQLAVLVDRGEHELPIKADFVGKNVHAPQGQRVYVRMSEIDGSDAVLLGAAR